MSNKIFKYLKNILQYVLIVAFAAILAVFLFRLAFTSCHIVSHSMRPALVKDDYVLANKLTLGVRLIRDSGVRRVLGIGKIKKNDIVVFNFPYYNIYGHGDKQIVINRSTFYIKRCVATPGDTFYIQNAECKVVGYNEVLGCLEKQQELFNMPVEKIKQGCYYSYPHDTAKFSWNVKQLGPLYIPERGDVIAIDKKNVLLYKNLIEYETGRRVEFGDSTVLLGGVPLRQYCFTKGYYFVVGDHIKDSHDSRIWGLLPEDHIVGKVFFIWKSKDKKGKLRWSRMFETL